MSASNIPAMQEVYTELNFAHHELRQHARLHPQDFVDDDGVELEPTMDVRLCVDDDGSWTLNTGDVCYDTYHSDYCADGAVAADDTAESLMMLASDLVSDIEEQVAEAQS